MASAWLLAKPSRFKELETSLKHRGVVVNRVTDDVYETALNLYGARGVLLIDSAHPAVETGARCGLSLIHI